MKQSFEDFMTEYATLSNALTYDKMEDKIYHLANITGLRCDHSRLYKLEDKLLEILDEFENGSCSVCGEDGGTQCGSINCGY